MVLDSKQTTIAYRCPDCGSGVVSGVGLFSLTADMMKLKCSCGKSEMTVVYSKDGKIRLTVPCMLCAQPHNFTLNSSLFFGKDLFILPCPYTDVNICFIGNEEAVSRELERTELELLDMLGEDKLAKIAAANNSQMFTDPQIFDIIMFVIHDLEAENKIYCHCTDGGEYGADVLDDAIRVYCKKCGAERLVPTDSLLGAHAFLNCDSLHLE